MMDALIISAIACMVFPLLAFVGLILYVTPDRNQNVEDPIQSAKWEAGKRNG